MDGQQVIAGKLQNAIEDARREIIKIEILATALEAFYAPVPEYISPREQGGQWIGSDYPHSGPLEQALGFER